MSNVAITKVENDVFFAVQQAMELSGWTTTIKRGTRVSLKVNLGWDLFIPGSITSPLVVEGVIKSIYDYVSEIYIVESNQVLENIEIAYKRSNLDKVVARYNKVKWINMSKSSKVFIKQEKNVILKNIEVAEILLETDVITIPVMKTHDKTKISGAIKNQWGCLSELRHSFHLVLDDSLADINTIIKPKFAVMDATCCLEGNGPKSGKPKFMDLILASSDIVALDTVAAELMGIDSSEIDHLDTCNRRGLGENNLNSIRVIGETISENKKYFLMAKHNIVSTLELYLRKSKYKKLVFDTFFFRICLKFAKLYYLYWETFYGRNYRKKILGHPIYGSQWRKISDVSITLNKL